MTEAISTSELSEDARGRIEGLLDAADTLIEQDVKHHKGKMDDERNSISNHHTACHNTCRNMARDLQQQAIEIAMEDCQ